MRISDWSSDVCSSDLGSHLHRNGALCWKPACEPRLSLRAKHRCRMWRPQEPSACRSGSGSGLAPVRPAPEDWMQSRDARSEEHTSELQSLIRISYAVFCLKKYSQATPYRALDIPVLTCHTTIILTVH